MPGLGELVIVVVSLGLPIYIVVQVARAWRIHRNRQEEQIRVLLEMAKSLKKIDERIEALKHAANCDDRKDVSI